MAVLFAVVLAIIGSVFLWRSFAAVTPPASDLNNDGQVSLFDLSILLRNFNKTGPQGDINGDGKVNLLDLSILLRDFNKLVATAPNPPTPPIPGGGTAKQVEITYYGAWDNDPPGSRDIAHPVLHDKAGGIGTYADPLTFASPAGNGAYAWGLRIYVPSVQKYFVREDECATSWTAVNGCGPVSHVDLYVGNPSDSEAVIDCEEALTPNGNATIILDPAPNLTVDPKPLWNQATGQCGNLH